MSYFNKKEQVLDIELTQYGKHLLSVGKLYPIYYRFFDDDVLYDGSYAGINEVQNDAGPRIVDGTPHKTTQHNHLGLETELKRNFNEIENSNRVAEYKIINMQSTPEREYVLNNDMGASTLGEKNAPRFKLQFLSGEIENFSRTLTSSYQDLQIPQLDMDLIYKTEVVDFHVDGVAGTDPELASPIYDDGTTIIVNTNHILGLLTEDNVPFQKENFNIEVFEILDISGSLGTKLEKELRPLTFAEIPRPSIVNGILVEKEDLRKPDFRLTTNHVEYFFDIFTDGEISKTTLCSLASTIKSENIFADDLCLECPDLDIPNIISDPYNSNIDSQKVVICNDDGENT